MEWGLIVIAVLALIVVSAIATTLIVRAMVPKPPVKKDKTQ